MTAPAVPREDVIQSLWIGPRLPTLARLSIASFLSQGHPFHLYTYDKVENLPSGATALPAEDILPASAIFKYREHQSYAGYSNYFRYQMLLLKGGWWTDTDVVCLKPFRFDAPQVFSSESHRGKQYLNATVIKSPPGSPAMRHAARICQSKNSADLKWGDTGSKLIVDLVERFGLAEFVEPPQTFCPIDYADWRRLLDGDAPANPDPNASGVHLWNEMWQRAGQSTEANYDKRCLFERFKTAFLAQ